MSELALPPWDLCGFDRDFDPYSMPLEEWWANDPTWSPFYRAGRREVLDAEREALRSLGVNARDGEWRELAFMPYHATWPLVEAWKDGEHLERAGVRSDRPVPEYLTVAGALKRERELRVR